MCVTETLSLAATLLDVVRLRDADSANVSVFRQSVEDPVEVLRELLSDSDTANENEALVEKFRVAVSLEERICVSVVVVVCVCDPERLRDPLSPVGDNECVSVKVTVMELVGVGVRL